MIGYSGVMGIWDLLFPARCLGCQRIGEYLCAECVNTIQEIREPICAVCGKNSIGGQTHSRCAKPWGMDGLVASFNHRGVGRKLVTAYKYQMVADARKTLGELIISLAALEYLPQRAWELAAVPLHSRRERWRGFNQSLLIAQQVAAATGWGLIDPLVRVRQTKTQQGLSRKARLSNIQGAFALREGGRLNNKHVLLVDDVWTTGATMRECAKVLKRAGAQTVWGLAAARPEGIKKV
jgi:competence protein ComFC